MMLHKLHSLPDIQNKYVILRTDFNVPLKRTARRYSVAEDSKLRASLDTIEYLRQRKAKIVILSHLGRPQGRRVSSMSLQPVKQALGKILKQKVHFANGYDLDAISPVYDKVKQGQCLLLENIRFYIEEQQNTKSFAKKLSQLGDFYINDAFASCHRAHASVVGISNYLKSFAGHLIEKEIKALDKVRDHPQIPSVLVLGGKKIETKLPLLERMSEIYDFILVGGALANTFLVASGYEIGKSIYEEEHVDFAAELLKQGNIYIPEDVQVARSSRVRKNAIELSVTEVEKGDQIFDIGHKTIAHFQNIIGKAKSIVWNGPMGYYEHKLFKHGSKEIASALIEHASKSFVVVGGGETLDVIKEQKGYEHIDHISTGGGAMLSYLSGEKLPGLEVLKK